MWEILTNEERAVFALRALYRESGYAPYKMSKFEEYDLYVRCRDFLASDQIITFPGPGGKLLALKPDVTLSVIKNAPQEPGVVQKVYYNENVYRADQGSFREIMQTGVECVGDLSAGDIAQVVLLAAKSMETLGGRSLLNLSHMGFVWAVLDGSGLTLECRREALACIRKKSAHELKALCAREGVDAQRLLALISATDLDGLEPRTEAEKAAFGELKAIWGILEENGFGENVRLDFSVGNDMKYYNGVVFKGYLEGVSTGVLCGGQYDRLAQKMGRSSRAIGFAVYVDALGRR